MNFRLNARQIAVFHKWRDATFLREVQEAAFEEDCCVTSPFTFSFTPCGIGDSVVVQWGKDGPKLDLTIDDDNKFASEQTQMFEAQL